MTQRSVKVLLVEDHAVDARLVRELLRECGDRYEIVHTERLGSALEAARGDRFDVMLLDLSLPDASGLKTLKRAYQEAPQLPIVVMTGLGDEGIAVEAVAQGAQDYLVKGDIEPSLLERSIRYAIGRAKMLHALSESEERYALAVRGANDGLWDWHLTEDRIYFSARWKAMLDLEPDAVGDDSKEWFDRIHPDDVDQVRAAFQDHVEGRTEAFESEYRMRCRKGRYRWMLTRGLAVRDERGKAYRIAGSQTDVTQRKEAERQLLHNVYHDALTGLPNHGLLVERLARAMLRQEQQQRPFAVMAVGLDNHGTITDSLGPVVCDDWIQSVVRRLAECLQAEDTLARVAPDQFVMLIEGRTDPTQVLRLSERVQSELQRREVISGAELFTTTSIGITTSASSHDRPEDHLRDVGVAMSSARALGGGRHQVFDTTMHRHVAARLQLEAELRRGIDRGEFRIHYQPIVWLETGEVAGFEALLRWNHPQRGLLAPGEFLSVAEGAGLMSAICDYVLPEALRQTGEWHQQFPAVSPVFVNVNLSRGEFALPDLLARIDAALEDNPVPAFSLGIEMTESMIIEDDQSVVATLAALKERKIRLLLDDFGTGYSSMNCLNRYPIDTLKIDKSFLAEARGRGGGSGEIVRAIVTLAHSMGMGVTAEGIETPEQLSFVKGLGCELGQGYHFARPLPAETATAAVQHGYATGIRRPSNRAAGPERHSSGRVLVVDDDRSNRNLLQVLLEEEGFDVLAVTDGQECLEVAPQVQPDVILLDIRMPKMDGVETCRRLKRAAETTDIPVLFVTGQGEDDPTTIAALSAGGNDFLSKTAAPQILCARLATQVAISRGQAKLRRIAMTDELTGLFSRRFLFDSLRRAVKATSRRGSSSMACLLADVDHFKRINDTLGHIEGDRVLAKIAQTIDGHTRDTDLVARFGGEEFVVLTTETDLDGAKVVGENIRAAVARKCATTVSIGGAYLSEVPLDVVKTKGEVDKLMERLLRQADVAMYDAKRAGRNRVEICSRPVSAADDWVPDGGR